MARKHTGALFAPLLCILVAAALVVGVQAWTGAVLIGSDTIFHFNRFYDTSMQLKTGCFNWFQSNFGFQASARVVNALYGPLFAYLAGLILLACGTWFRFQLLTSFLVYSIAGGGMYYLARRVQASDGVDGRHEAREDGQSAAGLRVGARLPLTPEQLIALVVGIAYMNTGWMIRWQTNTNMSALGAMLAPYMCMVCLRMVCPRTRGGVREERVSCWSLALIVSVAAQIHLMTCALFLVMIAIFWIWGMVRATEPHERTRMFAATLRAVLIAVVLTGDVWVGLLEVMSHNYIAAPQIMQLTHGTLKLDLVQTGRSSMSWLVFVPLVGSAVAALVQRIRGRQSAAFMLGVVGASLVLASSPLVPWHAISAAVPALQQILQFPVRLLVVAYPLLFACLAAEAPLLVRKLQQPADPTRRSRVVRSCSAVALCYVCAMGVATCVANGAGVLAASEDFYTQLTKNRYVVRLSNLPDDDIKRAAVYGDPGELLDCLARKSPDYLPNNSPNNPKGLASLYRTYILGPTISHSYQHIVRKDGSLVVRWLSGSPHYETVPVITYAETQLTSDGTEINPAVTRIGMPVILSHRGVNELVVRFVVDPYKMALIAASVLAWPVLGAVWLLRRPILKKRARPAGGARVREDEAHE